MEAIAGMEPRISMVTLGVEDLDRAVGFYEAMGLEWHKGFNEGVAFFQMGGLILALWPREELARDAGIPRGPVREPPPVGVALAYNTRSVAEVGAVLARAEKAGGRILKQAGKAFWGGTQGYFYDTEDNLWEVAFNADFPLNPDGSISLPA